MQERKLYLDQHPYKKFFDSKKGYYVTYVLNENKKRKQIKCKTLEGLDNKLIEYYKKQTENPTLEEVFNEWNDRRLALEQISKATYDRYTEVFLRHFLEIKDNPIQCIFPDDLEFFFEEQIYKHQLTASGFANLKTVANGFFKRARKRKLIAWHIEDVFSELDISKKDYKKVVKEDCEEVFNEAETALIMTYLCENLDLRNLGILLMFVTGVRVGELVALKHKDFDNGILKIRRTETRYRDEVTKKNIYDIKESPKTDASVRDIVIPPDYVWIDKRLRLQNPFGEFIFVENGKRFTTNVIRRRLNRICKKLNIRHKSPHKVRKTYGSILIDNNVDEKMIRDQMGHTSILCTEQHYHRNRKTVDRKSTILGNISEFHAM